MSCCLDISDVELQYNRRVGLDVIFLLQSSGPVSDDLGNPTSDELGNPVSVFDTNLSFNPREGDYYTVVDDIATLVKVVGSSEISDDIGGFVSDDTGQGINAAVVIRTPLTDSDGNPLFDADGNPLYID